MLKFERRLFGPPCLSLFIEAHTTETAFYVTCPGHFFCLLIFPFLISIHPILSSFPNHFPLPEKFDLIGRATMVNMD